MLGLIIGVIIFIIGMILVAFAMHTSKKCEHCGGKQSEIILRDDDGHTLKLCKECIAKFVNRKSIVLLLVFLCIIIELLLSYPILKKETIGICCVRSTYYMLMPGVYLLEDITIRKYDNKTGEWSEEITFKAYRNNQHELEKLNDCSSCKEITKPVWFEIKYVEVGIFPFREKQVISVSRR